MLKHFFIILIYIFVIGCKSDKTTTSVSSGDPEIDQITAAIEKILQMQSYILLEDKNIMTKLHLKMRS